MRAVQKARQILRTHGFAGLALRSVRHVRRKIAMVAQARAQRRSWEKLLARSGNSRPVFFPRHERPLVSVIVPVYNHVRYTAACLNALLRELDSIPCEVIVVDDGSTDGTADYLRSCSGLKIITHVNNRGFVASVNGAADVARGRFLHFLNNDTIVTRAWMSSLLRTFESREQVGAVGSQLRAPNGRICEAGAIAWRDGEAENFGRGRSANDEAVAFPREVDYCSAASLMVRAEIFHELGGFSTEFAPASYEDIDLCFRIRASGHRVLYQPASVVVHFEGGSAGADMSTGAKRFQRSHRDTFTKKWSAELARHLPPDADLIERAARRLAGKRTALVIDSFIPFDDRSAGGRRLLAIMQLMRQLDWHVIFVADDGGAYEPYTTRARRAGIEVIPHRGDALRTIRDLPVNIDLAWVSRPDVLQKYLPLLHRRTNAKIIYDTVDLHFVRMQREARLNGRDNGWESMRDLECSLARKADCTVVTSIAEREILAQAGITANVVPIIEQPIQTRTAYPARHDLLFLANYTHEPNVDSAVWLVSQIMSLVWERLPDAHLILAGAEPTPTVQRLAGERVTVTGHVQDIRLLFENARLFVAPLRFGAGMKGKIVQSLAHGLPVVTSPIGAEGIGLRNGLDAIIANDARDTADAIVQVYTEEKLWTILSENAQSVAQQFTPAAVRPKLQQALEAALKQSIQVGVDDLGLSTHSA